MPSENNKTVSEDVRGAQRVKKKTKWNENAGTERNDEADRDGRGVWNWGDGTWVWVYTEGKWEKHSFLVGNGGG